MHIHPNGQKQSPPESAHASQPQLSPSGTCIHVKPSSLSPPQPYLFRMVMDCQCVSSIGSKLHRRVHESAKNRKFVLRFILECRVVVRPFKKDHTAHSCPRRRVFLSIEDAHRQPTYIRMKLVRGGDRPRKFHVNTWSRGRELGCDVVCLIAKG